MNRASERPHTRRGTAAGLNPRRIHMTAKEPKRTHKPLRRWSVAELVARAAVRRPTTT